MTCIAGAGFYFGLQTDVHDPRRNGWAGKGLIFSTWGSYDLADVRVAGEDGFYQQSTHEGAFVGVRRPYAWQCGRYRVVLERREEERGGDWFEVAIGREGAAAMTSIGSLRFARRVPTTAATIRADGVSFLEVYSNASTEDEIAPWHVGIMARGDGQPATHVRSEYPAFPFAEVKCTDTWYDDTADLVLLSYGLGVTRHHAAGVLVATRQTGQSIACTTNEDDGKQRMLSSAIVVIR